MMTIDFNPAQLAKGKSSKQAKHFAIRKNTTKLMSTADHAMIKLVAG